MYRLVHAKKKKKCIPRRMSTPSPANVHTFPGECPHLPRQMCTPSPANVHTVFSIQTAKFCARLLCALAKTSPVARGGGGGVLSDFSSVKIFWQMWPTLDQTFSAKKKKILGGQASGWACRTRVQTFRALSLKNGVDIWKFVRKNE